MRKKSGFQAERARRRTQLSVEEQNYRENALQQSKSGAFIVLDDQILLLLLPFFAICYGVFIKCNKNHYIEWGNKTHNKYTQTQPRGPWRHRDSERVTQVNPESEQPRSTVVTIILLSKILPKHTHSVHKRSVYVWGWGRRLKSVNTPRLNTDRQWLFSYQHLCPQANKHSHAHLLAGVNSAQSEHRRCIIE